MSNQLIEARTEITFIPRNKKNKVRKPVTLKDFARYRKWNGGKKDIDILVTHIPGNGSADSAPTRIDFNPDTISWQPSENLDGVVEFTPDRKGVKSLFIKKDGIQVRLNLSDHPRYSEVVISRQSQPAEPFKIAPIADVIESLTPYNPHRIRSRW
jgi:hypothetical protein